MARAAVVRRMAAVVVLVAALAVPMGAGAQAPGPTADPCTAFTGPMTPPQALERYGLQGLVAEGHQGQGIRIAQLQWGATVDRTALDTYSHCMGVPPLNLVSRLVGTSESYGPSGESGADAEMVAGLAPQVEGLYVFTGPQDDLRAETLDPLLLAALDPANTGGQRVDIISISYNSCEESFGDTASTEAILAAAEAVGVWVLKGAGDSGSSGCAPHGTCSGGPSVAGQAVGYPASSWHVISLGGVSFPGPDPVTAPQFVWNQQAECSATGGGPSHLFGPPPWQASLPGGLTNPARMVPDVSSLAGAPGYLTYSPATGGGFEWRGTEGDSLTGPVWAAALAIVRSSLSERGVTVDGPLLPQLYAIATSSWDPTARRYSSVFTDVVPVEGRPADNDVRGNGCCDTLVGYDMTNGLGTVDFAELADALAARNVVPTPMPAPAAPTVEPAFTG